MEGVLVVQERRLPEEQRPAPARQSSLAVAWARLLGSLLATLPFVPLIGAVVALGAFFLSEPPTTPNAPDASSLLVQVGLDLVVTWGALALIHAALGLSRPDRCIETSYQMLESRISELEAMQATSTSLIADDDADRRLAHDEIRRHLNEIRRLMASEGPQWVLGYVYIDLWRRLHRAEDAWLALAPRGALRASLDNANLAVSESKLNKEQREAIKATLSAVEKALFSERPSDKPSEKPAEKLAEHAFGTKVTPAERVAISRLTTAWQTIHRYRDDRWGRLLEARNRLLQLMGLCGLVTYALVWLAIVAATAPITIPSSDPTATATAVTTTTAVATTAPADATNSGLTSAATTGPATMAVATTPPVPVAELRREQMTDTKSVLFALALLFFLGATIGLFGQLANQNQAARADDDYGLSQARIMVTPLVSGLAAVIGVGLVAAVNAGGNTNAPKTIEVLSSFRPDNASSLLLGGIFGLMPKVLLDRIKQWHEDLAEEVESTQPGEAKSAPG